MQLVLFCNSFCLVTEKARERVENESVVCAGLDFWRITEVCLVRRRFSYSRI